MGWVLTCYLIADCVCGPDYFGHGMNAISQTQNFLSQSCLLNPINEHWPRTIEVDPCYFVSLSSLPFVNLSLSHHMNSRTYLS